MVRRSFNAVEVEVPDEWIDTSVISLVAPGGAEGFRPNLVVTRDFLAAPDAETYGKNETREIRKAVKRYSVHREESTTVDGRTAYLVEHSYLTQESTPLRQIQVYVASGQTVYTVTLTSSEDEFDGLRDRFLKMAKSLKLPS